MTAADPEQKNKTAKALFIGFFGLALGWAGVLVAAVAVATESAWGGGTVERDRARERSRGWLGEQRAWLDADHKQRTARADARRQWLEAGGDPATEPAGPSRAKRVGSGIRRLLANVAVAGSDFVGGFRDGWKAAKETRASGGGFRDIASARPEGEARCTNCRRHGIPVAEAGLCADCLAVFERPAVPNGATNGVVHESNEYKPVSNHCTRCSACGWVSLDLPSQAAAESAFAKHYCHPTSADPDASRRLDEALERTKPQAPPTTTAKGDGINTCPRCGGPLASTRQLGRACPHCDRFGGDDKAAWIADCPRCHTECYVRTVRPRTELNPGHQSTARIRIHYLNDSIVCPTEEQIRAEENGADAIKPASTARTQAGTATTSEGDTMTAPTPSASAPVAATESNATVLRAKLTTTKTTLHRIAELTDHLAKERATLDGQVRDADEFATSTGQSAQARQALDEANAVSTSMGARLGEFSQNAVSAEEQVAQAADGLRVAENAEDELRSAGADGRAVAPAGANA